MKADNSDLGRRSRWTLRLNRKTICFSKLELLLDTVIGLLINKLEFGLGIHA
jgi:insertion element IS1 protein InsB